MDPKTKEFLKPNDMTIMYFFVLVSLAFITSFFALSTLMSNLFTSLFFILCMPIALLLFLPDVGALIIAIPLELLYLYLLALILSKMMKTKYVLVLAVIFLIIGFFIWQTERAPSRQIVTGWNKLHPLKASIAYKANGSFETKFQNIVGTSINVTNITMEDKVYDSPLNCTNIRVNSQTPTPAASVSVKAGDGFALTATCGPSLFAAEGDPFDLLITIQYTAVMGGVNTNHNETGHIRGLVEP